MVSALGCCRQDGDFRECSWADAEIQDVKAWTVPSLCKPGKEGEVLQGLQRDLKYLPCRMSDFCLILGRRAHRPILSSDLLWGADLMCCAIPLLLILPALHFWGLLLQQLCSEERRQWGSSPKLQLLLQMRLDNEEHEQSRSCRCLLFLRLQHIPDPCFQPSRHGNITYPSAMGTTCVLNVAQLDQTQLAQHK